MIIPEIQELLVTKCDLQQIKLSEKLKDHHNDCKAIKSYLIENLKTIELKKFQILINSI